MWQFADNHPIAFVVAVTCVMICLTDISANIVKYFLIKRGK